MKTGRALLLTAAASTSFLIWTAPEGSAADLPAFCGNLIREYENSENADFDQLRRFRANVQRNGRCPELLRNVSDRIRELEMAQRRTLPAAQNSEAVDCDRRTVERTLRTGDEYLIRRLQRCGGSASQQAAAWLAANGGRAPGPERLIFNEPIRAEFTDSDPTVGDLHYREYRLNLRPGDRVEVIMASESQRSVVAIGTGRLPDGFRELGSGVGGDSEAASVVYLVPPDAEPGEYTIVAASVQPVPYTLDLHQFTPAPLPSPRPIVFGQSVRGALSSQSARAYGGGDYLYEAWSFTGQEGQRVRISMESDEFDTYLVLGRVLNGEFQELARDDDGGEGLNSLIFRVLEADAEYVVRARAFSGAGAYQLSVQSVERGSATQPRRVDRNANAWVIPGALMADSAADEDFRLYQDFEFRTRRNRHYEASLRSPFSAIVDVGVLADGQVEPIDFYTEDADRDATLVEFTAPRNGPIVLRVRSVSGGTGEFSLVVREIDAPTQPPASSPDGTPIDEPVPGGVAAAPDASEPASTASPT